MAQFINRPATSKYGFAFTSFDVSDEQQDLLRTCIGKVGVRYIVFGREICPKTRRPHLQGYLQSNQKNKSRIYDTLHIHVSPQRDTAEKAANYCKKDGDFDEVGVFNPEIKGTKEKSQGERNDISAVMAQIRDGKSYEEICETNPGTVARAHKFVREQIQMRDTNIALAASRERFESLSLYAWQTALKTTLENPADPRKIIWIWSSMGNTGKSTFATYLGSMMNATVLDSGKKVDLSYIYACKPTSIVVFDLARTLAPEDDGKSKLDHLYALAETLKNGRLTSTKYDSKTIYFPTPHVLFFSNFPPDYSKWSEDRYDVREITNTDCVWANKFWTSFSMKNDWNNRLAAHTRASRLPLARSGAR